MQQSCGDVCDRRLWRRQGSKKEWQQQGDWQVPLAGTQTEPLLQQDCWRRRFCRRYLYFCRRQKCRRLPSPATILLRILCLLVFWQSKQPQDSQACHSRPTMSGRESVRRRLGTCNVFRKEYNPDRDRLPRLLRSLAMTRHRKDSKNGLPTQSVFLMLFCTFRQSRRAWRRRGGSFPGGAGKGRRSNP